MNRFCGLPFKAFSGLLMLVIMTGCAVYPPPKMRVPFWQHPRFNNENPPKDVKLALTYGDHYRELVAAQVGDPNPQSKANVYWYAEEGIKFYKHVLDELEPHNAYAAVCIGHMYIMRARKAPKRDQMIELNAAHNRLNEADEKRRGYADTYRYMGEMYAIQREWYKAESAFAKLIDSGFGDSHIYAWWGYVLKKQAKIDQAKVFFRKAVEHGYPQQCAAWARDQM